MTLQLEPVRARRRTSPEVRAALVTLAAGGPLTAMLVAVLVARAWVGYGEPETPFTPDAPATSVQGAPASVPVVPQLAASPPRTAARPVPRVAPPEPAQTRAPRATQRLVPTTTGVAPPTMTTPSTSATTVPPTGYASDPDDDQPTTPTPERSSLVPLPHG